MAKLLLVLSVLVLFGDSFSLSVFNGYFDYMDHAITALIFIVGFCISFKFLLSNNDEIKYIKKAILAVYMISIFAIGRTLFNENITLFGMVVGYIYFFKFFYFFISGVGLTYFFKRVNVNTALFIRYLKIVFTFLVLMTLLNLMLPDLWSEIYPVQVIFEGKRLVGPFTNAGRTSWLLVCFLIFVMVFYKGKKRLLLTLPLLYLQMLTYVKKSLFGFLIALVIYSKDTFKKYSSSNRVFLFLIVIVLLLSISFVFSDYFLRTYSEYSGDALNERNARYMLLIGGMQILNLDPVAYAVGAGLSSWGGYASSIVYSQYYYMLGFDNMWGFVPGASSYTGDLYIIHVIVEIGLIGSFLLFVCLKNIYGFIAQFECYNYDVQSKKAIAFSKLIFLLILIESLAISSLEISQMTILTFFVPGLYFGTLLKINRKR